LLDALVVDPSSVVAGAFALAAVKPTRDFSPMVEPDPHW